MQQVKCFFPLFMLVFLMGLLLHLLIPIQFVVNSTLRLEKSYNNYKLTIEQELIRSLATMNSLNLGNNFQATGYPVRSMFKMFEIKNRYENVDMVKFDREINNAYQLANVNSEQLQKYQLSLSMWHIPNVSTIADMSQEERKIFNRITNIQPFFFGLNLQSNIYRGIKVIELIIVDGDVKIYFANPSSKQSRFSNIQYNDFEKYFTNTFQTFKSENRTHTIFHERAGFRVCSPYFEDQKPYAVMCLLINSEKMQGKFRSLVTIPNFQLSLTYYHMIRAIYFWQNITFPQIITIFSDSELKDFRIQYDKYFYEFGPDQSNRLFSGISSTPKMHMLMASNTKTINVLPIRKVGYLDQDEVLVYMLTVNNFEKSQLSSESRYQEFLLVMTIPSIILFLIAAAIMAIIMKRNFSTIEENSEKMSKYCRFIKLNDFELSINETEAGSDFNEIFNELQNLNILNKLVSPAYFEVSVHERIIRLFGALELFSKLQYDKDNVYFHLYECYRQKGELENAFKFLQLSIDCLKEKLQKMGSIKTDIGVADEETKMTKNCKSKKEQSIIKSLRFQLFCSVRVLHELHRPGDKSITSQMNKNISFLQKLNENSFKPENLFCLILQSICELDDDDVSLGFSSRKVSLLQEMMNKYINNNRQSSLYFPKQVLKAYWHFLNGKMLTKKENYLEAFEFFVLSLDGDQFDPLLHHKIKQEIVRITKIYSISSVDLKTVFFHQHQKKREREFIFVYDTSNPHMSREDFKEWKKEVRSMTGFISDNFIHNEDRIGINEFCQDIKVICNLIEKEGNENLLKKQLLKSVKAKDLPIYSELLGNIGKVIERTCSLKNQKVFIVFLKEGESIGSEQMMETVSKCPNSIFLFMVKKNSQRVANCGEKYFVVEMSDREAVEIILRNKRTVLTNHSVYLL